jgi:integrase/recombinase XerD
MYWRSSGFVASRAVVGFLQFKTAEALSNRTLESYWHDLTRWIAYAGDPVITKVRTSDLRAYFAWLMTEYQTRRFTGGNQPLSPKTARNIYITLSSFFRWASEVFKFESPIKGIPADLAGFRPARERVLRLEFQ